MPLLRQLLLSIVVNWISAENMAKKEISILYYIQKDGMRSSMYLNVKQKRFIFGSAEHCGIRIYKNDIFPEHCALTTGKKGKVFIEPLHPSSLTLINNIKLVHRICLNDNDIITICGERFFFTYLSDNLFNKQIVKISSPISCTEQAQRSKKLKIIHSGKKNHEEKIINHKQIQHTESLFKLPITLVSSQPKLENINQNMTVKTNTSYNNNCLSDVNSDKKKQKNRQSSRKISSSYKKRVSLAVKQYHLRKRKSVFKAKCAKLIDVENSAPLVKKKQIKAKPMNGTDENINDASKRSKSKETKGKRCYKKKNTDTHTTDQISESQPNEVKQFKEKRRYKKKNNEKEIDKTDSNKCIQKFEKQEVSPFKRITRSMAKSQSSLRY
ncbi:FHA domain-containing protein [Caerostris darwini]|uniref:FHA domain-containing protein n=1 Tax=Caerostris darwini TaxID=1538125 RepID=A0AAV4N4Q0_9ARAC|nr:FHA domain-containing protein [Caerostris darwini]